MNPVNLWKNIYNQLEALGFRARLTSTGHLEELKQDINEKKASGSVDETFFRKWLAQFKFETPQTLPEAKSIVITAAPRPQERVTFAWRGGHYSFIIPPTYTYHTDKRIQGVFEKVLIPSGFRIEKTVLPLKLLAVRSGLARYGRNNISYIEDLGSFYRLKAYFTDLPCEEDSWSRPKVMEACARCGICEKNCPTHALDGGRFLIRAEKCLTYHNEGEEAFPAWLDRSWHHCLVGCLKCQLPCPQNKPFRDWIEDRAGFTEPETALLLNGAAKETLAAETVAKLENCGLHEYLEVLPRNLSVLLQK